MAAGNVTLPVALISPTMAAVFWRDGSVHCRHGWVLGFQLFQHLLGCLGIDLLALDKAELKGL